jgi:hypothetical protein
MTSDSHGGSTRPLRDHFGKFSDAATPRHATPRQEAMSGRDFSGTWGALFHFSVELARSALWAVPFSFSFSFPRMVG